MTDEPLDTALPEERRLRIAAQVRRDARVRVDDLARRFGVSGETVRRDLQVLEERGMLRRVYGGAVVAEPDPPRVRVDGPDGPGSSENREPADAARPPRPWRGHAASAVQRRIAALAATLIEPDDTVVLHGDALVQQLARVVPASFAGRVLCASLPVAAELAGRDGVDVLVAGGQVRPGDLGCVGPVTEQFFRQYFADKVFLTAGGVHPRAGLTQRHLADIAVQQVVIGQTRECYVLAEPASLGRTTVGRVAGTDAITAVVTDASADPDDVRALEQAGVKVLLATPDPAAD